MAEDQKKPEKKIEQKSEKKPEKESKRPPQLQSNETLIRIFGYDLPGSRNIYSGLTRIKGVSWTISNAVCLKLKYPRSKRISELTKDDIQRIESFLKELPIPDYLKNRRSDPETGKTLHNFGTDLEIAREFDIKKLKKIRSYKGIRHSFKLPVRGQRTRSHFRAKTRATGIKSKKPATAAIVKPTGAKK